MLNTIFSAFDDLTEVYGLEKIKTIGDARPVCRIMALAMRQVIEDWNRQTGLSLQIRIGLNSGAVVAGVIGKKKFIYDLWGDAVNIAARMESHGIPCEIQVSEPSYLLLKDRYRFVDRGMIDVKGKGSMHVYLLKGLCSV